MAPAGRVIAIHFVGDTIISSSHFLGITHKENGEQNLNLVPAASVIQPAHAVPAIGDQRVDDESGRRDP